MRRSPRLALHLAVPEPTLTAVAAAKSPVAGSAAAEKQKRKRTEAQPAAARVATRPLLPAAPKALVPPAAKGRLPPIAAAGDAPKSQRAKRKRGAADADAAALADDTDTARKSKSVAAGARGTSLPRTIELKLMTGEGAFGAVFGVDEAGRGPLAGPVVAAACYLPLEGPVVDGIFDSKLLKTEEQREQLYEAIVAAPGVQWATCAVDEKRIDEINILQATLEAMRTCSTEIAGRAALRGKSAVALVDGNRLPLNMPCEARSIIGGDGLEYCIAAASILAKVTRDRIMLAYDKKHPKWNFAQHKGYGTPGHMAAIREHGSCEIHRLSFAPFKTMQPAELHVETAAKKGGSSRGRRSSGEDAGQKS